MTPYKINKINIFSYQKQFFNKILTRVFVSLVIIVAKTWRFNILTPKLYEQIQYLSENNEKFVFVFWHQKMLAAWYFVAKIFPKQVSALISKSNDGEILTKIISSWNVNVVRGSSSDGGKNALETLLTLSDTYHIMLTPDGPRGPIFQSKPGALLVSAKKQKKIILVGLNAKSKIIFSKSWDKFHFPLPFSSIEIKLDFFPIPMSEDRQTIDKQILELNLILQEINSF